MKKLICILVMSFINNTFANEVEASPTLVGDRFTQSVLWEAPMVSSITLRIGPLNDLSFVCSFLERKAKDYLITGNTKGIFRENWDSGRRNNVSLYRKYPIFVITPINGIVVTIPENSGKREKSLLPHFYQKTSLQSFSLSYKENDRFLGIENKEGIKWTLSSLTEHFGLEAAKPEKFIINPDDGNSYIVEIKDNDLACDLLAGRVSLKYKINSDVTLEYEQERKVMKFYGDKIFPEVKEALEQHDGVPVRQALNLGYGVGKEFELETGIKDIKTIKQIINDFSERFFVGNSITPKLDIYRSGVLDDPQEVEVDLYMALE